MSRTNLTLVLAVIAVIAVSAYAQKPDPAHAEVPLPATAGWNARLVYEGDAGIWTVGTLKCFPSFGCPEIFGLDDRGRCIILWSYSGKWTPILTTQDNAWLGALVTADLDPTLDGEEIYTGGKNGNLYELQPREYGGFDVRVMAHLRGEEIHTLVAGDLLPGREGSELLAFSRRGEVVDMRWRAEDRRFDAVPLAKLPGRIRQAALIPAKKGERPWIAAVGRYGEVMLLRMKKDGLEKETIVREPMGFGRMSVAPRRGAEPLLLYATRDDGVILRLERAGGGWKREVIYAGPQGARGVVAGRFDEDPAVETVAVFGYSKKVQLLSRRAGEPWKVETVFEDVDKGHWLARAELDGRNGTDELIGSGYGKRIFLLSRPAGYGLDVATDPDPTPEPRLGEDDGDEADDEDDADDDDEDDGEQAALRIALPAGRAAVDGLSPLRYRGGFGTKTLVYDTLVRRDRHGRIVPALATSFRHENGGRTWIFELDAGARFHDGSAVTATAVRTHFRRWVGLPEHAWVPASSLVRDVLADGPTTLRVELERPHALLPDLCAINPCAVTGPATFDHQGEFTRPVGTGPFSWDGSTPDGHGLLYRCRAGRVVARLVGRDGRPDPLDLLLAGEIDVIWDGWLYEVPRDRLDELRARTDIAVTDHDGSSVEYLDFSFVGATANRDVRRAVAAAVRREELVRRVEGGLADPCTTWTAPAVSWWRASSAAARPAAVELPGPIGPLRILADARDRRQVAIARALASQLADAGLRARVAAPAPDVYRRRLDGGDYDVRITRTWGVPYDPHLSLVARFLPEASEGTAVTDRLGRAPGGIADLVRAALAEPDETARIEIYARIQEDIDRHAAVVPLYAPRRVVVRRAGIAPLDLDLDLYRADLAPLLRGHV